MSNKNSEGVCKLSFEPFNKQPRIFAGNYLCSLMDKGNFLIDKLYKKIRKPSPKDAEMLGEIEVLVNDGKCQIFNKQTKHLDSVYDLGTPETPAFYYSRFIFVLDKQDNVFRPADIKVLYFNEDYVLGILPGKLIIKYDVKGLSVIGNFVSVNTIPNGYLLTASYAADKEKVCALTDKFELLFETNNYSKVTVAANGDITHQYISITGQLVVETYSFVPGPSGCYITERRLN